MKKKEKTMISNGLKMWEISNISLFSGDMCQVLMIIDEWITSKAKRRWIATVNPEFVIKSTKSKDFETILKKTNLNVVDGVGLLWAKNVKGDNFFRRTISAFVSGIKVLENSYDSKLVRGVDLISELCKLAAKRKYKLYFLGAFEDRAEKTAKYMVSKYSLNEHNVSWSQGEPVVDNKEVLRKINEFKPDVLFVAYGMKKQEEWIDNNLKKIDAGVVIGVGRSFDYYSGALKRAPLKWRKRGFEWLYSLAKEPRRIKRQIVLPQFIWKVLRNTL